MRFPYRYSIQTQPINIAPAESSLPELGFVCHTTQYYIALDKSNSCSRQCSRLLASIDVVHIILVSESIPKDYREHKDPKHQYDENHAYCKYCPNWYIVKSDTAGILA